MPKLILLLFCFSLSLMGSAQEPRTYTSSEILQQIKKLNVLGSVLYIGGHPDDENTRLLAWLANDKLYRTAYLSMTRGDGGQNLIGDELGVELGLIRTQELLAARRIDGAEQYFTRAYDFGFSKNSEETFIFWDKQKILSDVVWVIRKFRPDVIITRFPSTGEGGHGHHTASAILAEEAFDQAADPSKFPEQLTNGVTVWQAKRLLWNTFNFGNNNTQREDQLKIDVGGFNPLLGKSYGEIASESRSQHKSQGFGMSRNRGLQLEYFKTIKGSVPPNDLLEGVDISWQRTKLLQSDKDVRSVISNKVNTLVQAYSDEHPENSVQGLMDILSSLSNINDGWGRQKAKEVIDVIENCGGLFMEAFTRQSSVVQGDSLKITAVINNRLGLSVTHATVSFRGDHPMPAIEKNRNSIQNFGVLLDANEPISQPYWLEKPLNKGTFAVSNQDMIGLPENPVPGVTFTVTINGRDLKFFKPLLYKFNDPVRGEVYQPLAIIPAVTFNDVPSFVYRRSGAQNMRVTYTANIDGAGLQKGRVYTNTIALEDGSKTYTFNYPVNDKDTGHILRRIQYDHIPVIAYFKPAITEVKKIDVKIAGNQIGYINGAGDKVPEALKQMGYNVTMLGQQDMDEHYLKQFDAVITGVRAFNVHEWMANANETLMKYVKDGGVVVVQYNVNGVRAKIGPYPFIVSGSRVTDEEAAVNFLAPQHPVLNYPNKITEKDFEGWIQERSTYHADKLDSNYTAILSMKDPGEKENNGALIAAEYGKGRFIYSGLVFFRELPAGIPGAYRLFANLLAPRQKTNKGGLGK